MRGGVGKAQDGILASLMAPWTAAGLAEGWGQSRSPPWDRAHLVLPADQPVSDAWLAVQPAAAFWAYSPPGWRPEAQLGQTLHCPPVSLHCSMRARPRVRAYYKVPLLSRSSTVGLWAPQPGSGMRTKHLPCSRAAEETSDLSFSRT